MRVGLIGLGHMGLPMAGRLAAGGFPLTVWNRTPGRATRALDGYSAAMIVARAAAHTSG